MSSKKVGIPVNPIFHHYHHIITNGLSAPPPPHHPSVPVNTRTASRTTILPTGGGPDLKSPVLIPKGSQIAFSVYAMHRRPDLYGMDAELFRPERWGEDMPLFHNPVNVRWEYLPFNRGPRICLGSK